MGPTRSHRICHTEVKPLPFPPYPSTPTSPSSGILCLHQDTEKGEAPSGVGLGRWVGQRHRTPGSMRRVDRAVLQPPPVPTLAPIFSGTRVLSCRVAQKARGISGRSSVQSSTAPTSRASATGGCPTTQVRALLRSAAGFSQHTLGSHSPLEMRCHLDNDLILSTAHCSPETGVARSFPSFPLSMQSSDVPVSRPASSGSEALPLHHRGVWDSEGPHGGVVLYGANSAKG